MLGCCVGNSKSQLHKVKLRIRERLVRSPKACPRPFELVDHAPNPQGHYLRSGAVHRAECRNVADIGHSPQLIPTRWQPASRRITKGKLVGSTRFPWVIRADMR
jgi:hypothetical protein